MKKGSFLGGLAGAVVAIFTNAASAQPAPYPVSKPPEPLPLPGPAVMPEGVMRLQEDVWNIFANLIAHESILANEQDPYAIGLGWALHDQAQDFVNDTSVPDLLESTYGIAMFSQAMDRGIDNLRHFFTYAPYQNGPDGMYAAIYTAMYQKLSRIAQEWSAAKQQELPPLYAEAQRREADQIEMNRWFELLQRQQQSPARRGLAPAWPKLEA